MILKTLFSWLFGLDTLGHAVGMHKADGVRIMGWVGKALRLRVLSR